MRFLFRRHVTRQLKELVPKNGGIRKITGRTSLRHRGQGDSIKTSPVTFEFIIRRMEKRGIANHTNGVVPFPA